MKEKVVVTRKVKVASEENKVGAMKRKWEAGRKGSG